MGSQGGAQGSHTQNCWVVDIAAENERQQWEAAVRVATPSSSEQLAAVNKALSRGKDEGQIIHLPTLVCSAVHGYAQLRHAKESGCSRGVRSQVA